MQIRTECIPDTLKHLPHWVCWRIEQRATSNGDVKPTKVPFNARTGYEAKSNDKRTWSTFEQAVNAHARGGYNGIGIVAHGDGLIGIDLDTCRNPLSGEIEPWALDIIERVNSYTEISPSGTGIRIFASGQLPPGRRKMGSFEVYNRGRFLTVTGHHLSGTPTTVNERTGEIAALHADLSERYEQEQRIKQLIKRIEQDAKTSALWHGDSTGYPSQSEADLALCSHLAYIAGHDAPLVDTLFRKSKLYRDKWDEQRGDTTYGHMTVAKAVSSRYSRNWREYHDDDEACSPIVVCWPSVPPLPAFAILPDELGQNASPWLDEYIAFSQRWSPQSYAGFHAAVGVWVLSTVAARRVVLDYGGPLFTNLSIILCARTSLYAKSTVAGIARQVLDASGLAFLLAPDDATPQAFLRGLTAHVPEGFSLLDDRRRAILTCKLAFAAQRGWFYDEFGQKLHAMMQSNGTMADFRGHLRRLDDCPLTYEYVTVGRGNDLVERPYLALLASMTPADLKPHARAGSLLWGDGFLARFALVAPPARAQVDLREFPVGERIIPPTILQPLRAWHTRLGISAVSITERMNTKGEGTGCFDATIEPRPPQRCTFGDGVREAVGRYRRALYEIMQQDEDHTDLDGNYARFHIKALRIAMLLASLENNGRIELRHWARAQQITEHWRTDLHHLVGQLAHEAPSRERTAEDRILAFLQRQTAWITPRIVAQHIKGLSTSEIKMYLERMADAGVLETQTTTQTTKYRALSKRTVPKGVEGVEGVEVLNGGENVLHLQHRSGSVETDPLAPPGVDQNHSSSTPSTRQHVNTSQAPLCETDEALVEAA